MKKLKIMFAAGVMVTFLVMNGCGSKHQQVSKCTSNQSSKIDTSYISEVEMIELKEEWKFALSIVCDRKGMCEEENAN